MLLLITTTACANIAKNNSKTPKETTNEARNDSVKIGETIALNDSRAFTKNMEGYNYVILEKAGVEVVVDKAPDDPIKNVDKSLQFSELEFSPNGNYLKYKATGWEWEMGRVFDIKNNKQLLELDSPKDFGFMNNGEYLYACAQNDFVGVYYAKVFKAPDFNVYKEIEINTSTLPIDIECKYLKDENVFVVSQMDNEKGEMAEVERVEFVTY